MKKFSDINVIPFIDIMLVLLAIVLATASFISQGKIEVNVPQSQSKVKVKQDDLVELITISKDGRFFYKDERISMTALEEMLGKVDKQRQITIKIDAESHFQHFVSVTDILSKYQLKKVTVLTASDTGGENPKTNQAATKGQAIQ